MMRVQLAFAPTPQTQLFTWVEVDDNATVKDALTHSDWLQTYPIIYELALGIFAEKVTWDTVLKPGDRVEIYRPLTIEPMKKRQSKMQLAKKKQMAR